jgi:LEA14-like dessication related protein
MINLQRLFALILLYLLAGCAALDSAVDFDEPEIELLGLEPLPGRGMEARFLVRLRIVNPNSVALDIDGMAYDVYLNDSKVLSGVSNRELRVDPYSESTAELEVAAGMLSSMRLIRDLMQNPPQDGLPYRLNAKLSRKGLGGTLRVSREGLLGMEPL